MKDDINVRLVAIMDKLGYKKSEYAEMFGVSPAVISHIYNNRNKAGLELIQQVLFKFNEINERWLLLGEGEMFAEQHKNQHIMIKEKLNQFKKKIANQSEDLRLMYKEIEELRANL